MILIGVLCDYLLIPRLSMELLYEARLLPRLPMWTSLQGRVFCSRVHFYSRLVAASWLLWYCSGMITCSRVASIYCLHLHLLPVSLMSDEAAQTCPGWNPHGLTLSAGCPTPASSTGTTTCRPINCGGSSSATLSTTHAANSPLKADNLSGHRAR